LARWFQGHKILFIHGANHAAMHPLFQEAATHMANACVGVKEASAGGEIILCKSKEWGMCYKCLTGYLARRIRLSNEYEVGM
jgi:hypothetical protein